VIKSLEIAHKITDYNRETRYSF